MQLLTRLNCLKTIIVLYKQVIKLPRFKLLGFLLTQQLLFAFHVTAFLKLFFKLKLNT
jgi:hypothetical protein